MAMNAVSIKERIAIGGPLSPEEINFVLLCINETTEPTARYLVWSNEHDAWWGPGRHGYSRGLDGAGRYSRDEALEICRMGINTAPHIGMIDALPVRLADLTKTFERQRIPRAILGGE